MRRVESAFSPSSVAEGVGAAWEGSTLATLQSDLTHQLTTLGYGGPYGGGLNLEDLRAAARAALPLDAALAPRCAPSAAAKLRPDERTACSKLIASW
jgi:hypothetical protein